MNFTSTGVQNAPRIRLCKISVLEGIVFILAKVPEKASCNLAAIDYCDGTRSLTPHLCQQH